MGSAAAGRAFESRCPEATPRRASAGSAPSLALRLGVRGRIVRRPILRSGHARSLFAWQRSPAAAGRHRSLCLIAAATVLGLASIGSAHAPTWCLCTGLHGSGQLALPLVV